MKYSNFVGGRNDEISFVSEKDGEVLPLKTNPVKLVEVRAREGECLVCSAVSQCGQWLAYSDSQTIRLFTVTLVSGGQASKHVSTTLCMEIMNILVSFKQKCFSLNLNNIVLDLVWFHQRCSYY